MNKYIMRTLLVLSIVFLAIQAPAVSFAADAPATTNAPFALVLITLEQINAASPFFTVDGKDRAILTNPPARLEDLQILRLWPAQAPLQEGDDPALAMPP